MKKGEELANVADYGGEQAASDVATKRLDPRRAAPSKEESRREGPWRLAPMMSPRTGELAAALLEDVRQIVRDELRAAQQTILQAIGEKAGKQSTAVANPTEHLTIDEVAEAMHVIPATVRMWIRQGNLRASRPPGISGGPGRVYRIARADLNEFIEATQRAVPHDKADIRAEAARIVAISTHRRKKI